MPDQSANRYIKLIEALMIKVAPLSSVESCFSKLGLAAVVEARERDVFAGFKGRGQPNAGLLRAADDAWLKHILAQPPQDIALKLAIGLGLKASGTPLEAALSRLEASDPSAKEFKEMRTGINEGLRRSMAFGDTARNIDDAERKSIRRQITDCATRIVDLILDDVRSGIERKTYLRHLNALILLEEAGLICGTSDDFEEKPLRKLAMDYALMRLFTGIDRLEGGSVETITNILRLTGHAARLSNPLSDALDRVQKYAAQVSKDPDQLEAAHAAGRPLPANTTDLQAAARQCRLFRDRERVV